jgi:hypothetical protein
MKRSGWLTLAAIAWSVVQNCQIAIAQQAGPTQTAPSNGAAGIQTSAVVYTPPGFSSAILAQGRRIYLDLSHALSAVYQRDAIELRLTLTDAQRRLAELYGGPDARALQAQMEIIRDDLRQAADDLTAVPAAQALAQELKHAAQNPTRKGLADLLSRLRERIQIQQRRESSAAHETPSVPST